MANKNWPDGVVRWLCEPSDADADLIRSFPRYTGPGSAGFVTDFDGTRTLVTFFHHMHPHDGHVLGLPLPSGPHHTALEWAGTLRAAKEAKGEFVVFELGAGWGPWLVSSAFVGRMYGLTRFRLVGVEGSAGHFEFLRSHFRDNGLNPDEHTLLHGIVAAADGTAEFPVLDDPAADWGAAAVAAGGGAGRRTEKLKAYSLPTLLAPFERVDLVHIDIQGHEADVIAASRDALRRKVKRLVIGTHSRAIEQRLFEELDAAGWVLEAEEPTIVRQAAGHPLHLFVDGCQVWRNPNRE